MTTNEIEAAAEILPAAEEIERERAQAVTRGIVLMLISVVLFSCMDVVVKWLGATYPILQIVFFRSLFAFIPLGLFIFRGIGLAALRTRRPFQHAVRSLVGLMAMICFFYAFSQMPLANAVAIGFAAPMFMTALSVPLLGEKVGIRRWTAVLVGFAGVLVIVRPDAGVLHAAAPIALAGTVFYALAMIFVRRLGRTETSTSIVFYFTLCCTLISGIFMPFVWVAPDAEGWVLLILVGLIGGLAQMAMTNAVRLADISIVAPFDYTALLWTALFGFLIWSDIPGIHVWLGAVIVVASGIYILYREAHIGLPRGLARRLQARR
ncbi:MAG: DMT family transporter [Alphaproteobacteria bacterium]